MAYTEATVLGIVKARLNRLASDTSLDDYLKPRIQAADIELARTGIHLLADDVDDSVLLADFVVWKHNNRDQNTGMPEWLRLARRERWLSGKGRQVSNIIATPSFGTLSSGSTITLVTATSGATIYYTLDGSEPSDTSTVYSGPISITESVTLRAIAYAQGLTPSSIFTKEYVVA